MTVVFIYLIRFRSNNVFGCFVVVCCSGETCLAVNVPPLTRQFAQCTRSRWGLSTTS